MRSFALDDIDQLRPLMADEILSVSGGDTDDGDSEEALEAADKANEAYQSSWTKRQAGDDFGADWDLRLSSYYWAMYDWYLTGIGSEPQRTDFGIL